MNNKYLLTVIFTTILICPAFATNITANNKDCTSDTLTTDSGSAVLEADWAANTINIKWYNDSEEIILTDGDPAKTCTYDGILTLPETKPTKTGYTFGGWRLKTCKLIFLPESADPGRIAAGHCNKILTTLGLSGEEANTVINSSEPVTVYEHLDCKKAQKLKTGSPCGDNAFDFE